MKYSRCALAGFGYALPPVVVSTEELEDRLAPAYARLRIPLGQLESFTGIVERRWWEPGYPLSQGAALAGVDALQKAGVRCEELDVLLYGAVCREDFEPATACHVAAAMARMGHVVGPHAVLHDISNACLGVLSGMLDIANRIELGQARLGMVVACESAREINEAAIARLLDDPSMERFKHSVATFTGGSGAVAVIVRAAPEHETTPRRLLGGVVQAAPAHHRLCRWGLEPVPGAAGQGPDPAVRPFASTDAAGVLEHGVALGERTFGLLMQELEWTPDAVDRTVCHQIGASHRQSMLPKLGLDPEHDFVAYDALGNTGTVALPLATALAHERDFLKPGHRVALLGIGSGLNCMMLGVQW